MNAKKGFTLIELLVVIAIIGILAAIVLASLNTARAKGRDARRLSDLKQIQLALALYSDANNGFPAVASAGAPPSASLAPNFISVVPVDPQNTGSEIYTYMSTDGAGNTCTGSGSPSICPGYVLKGVLEANNTSSGLTGTIAGVACTPGSGPYVYCVTN